MSFIQIPTYTITLANMTQTNCVYVTREILEKASSDVNFAHAIAIMAVIGFLILYFKTKYGLVISESEVEEENDSANNKD